MKGVLTLMSARTEIYPVPSNYRLPQWFQEVAQGSHPKISLKTLAQVPGVASVRANPYGVLIDQRYNGLPGKPGPKFTSRNWVSGKLGLPCIEIRTRRITGNLRTISKHYSPSLFREPFDLGEWLIQLHPEHRPILMRIDPKKKTGRHTDSIGASLPLKNPCWGNALDTFRFYEYTTQAFAQNIVVAQEFLLSPDPNIIAALTCGVPKQRQLEALQCRGITLITAEEHREYQQSWNRPGRVLSPGTSSRFLHEVQVKLPLQRVKLPWQ